MQELYQRIENAVAAYLIQYIGGDVATLNGAPVPLDWLWPISLQNADGSYRIFPGESDQLKSGQAILCIAEDSPEEMPLFTGNYYVPMEIWLRTPIKQLTPAEVKLNIPTALSFHEWAARNLSNALNQDPFLQAGYVNESGEDFTIMGGILDRKPIRQQVPNYYASGWSFRVYAMNRTAP